MVEGPGVVEHEAHVGHCRGVPGADRLVEGLGVVEHVIHVGHGRSVPGSDRLVEGLGVAEHGAHVGLCFRTTTWRGLSRPQRTHLRRKEIPKALLGIPNKLP